MNINKSGHNPVAVTKADNWLKSTGFPLFSFGKLPDNKAIEEKIELVLKV